MRETLVRLYREPGWTELEIPNQVKPYVEERRFVNGIGQKVKFYRLNEDGKEIARRILRKRGYDVGSGCGAAIQDRSWSNSTSYEGSYDHLVEAASRFCDIVKPPTRLREMPYGLLLQIMDVDQACLDFSKHVGWERHVAFGDNLKEEVSPALRWLWKEILVDLEGHYQEVVLWST